MSHAIEQTSLASQQNEFSYRPVPPVAPVTLFLGVCSVLSLMSVMALSVALLGVICGTLAHLKIRRSNGEFGGGTITVIGLTLSVLFLVSGAASHSYLYATEVPDGYRRVSFNRDIAMKGFAFENGASQFHPEVEKLSGEKVFLKGFMYPVRQPYGLTEFVFVKDSGKCCFGGQPKQTDMILVRMEKGKTTDLLEGRVSVAGTFKAEYPKHADDYGIAAVPVYQLEANYVSRSKTSF